MKCPHCGKDVYNMAERNEAIIDAVLSGETNTSVAKSHGISTSRVWKIIKKSGRAQREFNRRNAEQRKRFEEEYDAEYRKTE